MKIDEVIQRVVDDKRSAILLSRGSVTGTNIDQVTAEVLTEPTLAASLKLIGNDPYDLKAMIRRFIKSRVGQHMRTIKYPDTGVRQWEAVPIPGRRQRRWMPTRGMMVWQWDTSGQAKVRTGADTIYEGRLLMAMASQARSRGYKDTDVVRSGDFVGIVNAAKLAVGP